MFRASLLSVAGSLALASAAFGATFTYTSAPLTVINSGGIVGAKRVKISFYAPALPKPGACVMTETWRSFTDGVDTAGSLKTAGYIVKKFVIQDGSQERKVPVTYANICLAPDGIAFSGVYQLYATAGTNQYLANNQNAGGTDLAQFDIYFGGSIPQIYSSGSTKPGAWVIKP